MYFLSRKRSEILLERIRVEKESLVKQKKIKADKKQSKIVKCDKDFYENEIFFAKGEFYEHQADNTKTLLKDLPFEIPPSWTWCRGKNCFEKMQSKKPTGENFTYLDIESIDNKVNLIKKPKLLEVKNAPSRASRKVYNGCVLFSMVRPYLKNIALVTDEYSDAIASTGFFIFHSPNLYLPNFLYYMLLSPYVINGLNFYMKGDNSPSINTKNIEEFPFPLPPIAEQKRIVAKVEELISIVDTLKY